MQYTCFESFPFRQKFFNFVYQTTWFWWNVRHWTSGVNVHNKNSNRYVAFLNVPQLKEFLTFSVKDRYQLNYLYQRLQCTDNYFLKIKFVFLLYLLPSASWIDERKITCLDIFLLSDRQWGTEYQYLLCHFAWHLHITITYNLQHLRLWYVDVVTVIA